MLPRITWKRKNVDEHQMQLCHTLRSVQQDLKTKKLSEVFIQCIGLQVFLIHALLYLPYKSQFDFHKVAFFVSSAWLINQFLVNCLKAVSKDLCEAVFLFVAKLSTKVPHSLQRCGGSLVFIQVLSLSVFLKYVHNTSFKPSMKCKLLYLIRLSNRDCFISYYVLKAQNYELVNNSG